MIPMSLFAGVFFPVESLPGPLRWLAYVSPLWHGVELCRAATLGVAPDWSAVGHVLLPGGLGGASGWLLAYRRFAPPARGLRRRSEWSTLVLPRLVVVRGRRPAVGVRWSSATSPRCARRTGW